VYTGSSSGLVPKKWIAHLNHPKNGSDLDHLQWHRPSWQARTTRTRKKGKSQQMLLRSHDRVEYCVPSRYPVNNLKEKKGLNGCYRLNANVCSALDFLLRLPWYGTKNNIVGLSTLNEGDQPSRETDNVSSLLRFSTLRRSSKWTNYAKRYRARSRYQRLLPL